MNLSKTFRAPKLNRTFKPTASTKSVTHVRKYKPRSAVRSIYIIRHRPFYFVTYHRAIEYWLW